MVTVETQIQTLFLNIINQRIAQILIDKANGTGIEKKEKNDDIER